MLDALKLALRVSTDAYDAELNSLIAAGLGDLGLAGVIPPAVDDPLVMRAVITYCRIHFGSPASDYDKLVRAYETMKAQLMSATGYTDWGDEE